MYWRTTSIQMNTITATNIGTYLSHLRTERRLSLAETARRAHCTSAYISMLESRQRRPSVGMLYRLVSALSGDLDTALALLAQEEGVVLEENST